MRVLGINASFHDPAAAPVVDGQVVAAVGAAPHSTTEGDVTGTQQ